MNSGHIISFVMFFLHCQHLISLRILIYYVLCVKYIMFLALFRFINIILSCYSRLVS